MKGFVLILGALLSGATFAADEWLFGPNGYQGMNMDFGDGFRYHVPAYQGNTGNNYGGYQQPNYGGGYQQPNYGSGYKQPTYQQPSYYGAQPLGIGR